MVTTNSIGSVFVRDTKSTADASGKLFLDNTQRFLQLFTTQLKYQDPSEPMGTEQMTQQIATLSTVQQSIESNKNLEKLVAMQANSQASSATNLINREVEYLGNEFYKGSATEEQKFTYTLDKEYKKALIEVSDEKGKVIYKLDGVAKAGEQNFLWDGKDQNGNAAPVGKYKISINALDENDQYQSIGALTKDIVTGVDFKENGEPTLVFGDFKTGVRVSLSNIGSVNYGAITLPNNNS